jgi:Kelch motif
MLMRSSLAVALLLALSVSTLAQTASQNTNTNGSSTFPRLIRFSGNLSTTETKSVSGMTFALYADETGGSPLWLETQNVTVGANGHYSVLLGASSTDGVPAILFASNEARWLGVKPEGQQEQPRVLLVSVPYALKAGDAETLGGKPASAFVLSQSATPATVGSVQPNVTVVPDATVGVSSVTAASTTGLTATTNATTGAVTLGTSLTVLQARVSGTCAANQAIHGINSNGTVSCVALTTNALPTGFTVFGSSPTQTLAGYTYSGSYAEINGQAWESTSLAAMPENTNAFGYAKFNGNVYAFGVPDSTPLANPDAVQEFIASTGTWTTLTTLMPTARYGATAVPFGNYIYVFGGYDPNTYAPVAKCDYFDPAANRWNDSSTIGLTGCASIPTSLLPSGASGLAGMSGTAVPSGTNAGIYLFGGSINLNGTLSNRVVYYNPTTNTYPTTPAMPTLPAGLSYSTAVYTNSLIYVMGGGTSTQPNGTTQNLALNPASPSTGFVTKANLLDVRAYHTAAVSPSGQVYVAGDLLASDVTVPLYDPPSNTWVEFPQTLRGRNAPGSAVLSDGRFILFGGAQTSNAVDVFHPNLVMYEFQPN